MEPGRTFNSREVTSQEVNNNSKQCSNKRGPSKVLTLKHVIYPCVHGIPVEIIYAHKKYWKVMHKVWSGKSSFSVIFYSVSWIYFNMWFIFYSGRCVLNVVDQIRWSVLDFHSDLQSYFGENMNVWNILIYWAFGCVARRDYDIWAVWMENIFITATGIFSASAFL